MAGAHQTNYFNQLQSHDARTYQSNMTNASIQHFSWSSNTNPPTHIQFRCQPPRLPLQGKTPNIFQQQHVYGSQIPFNVHPVTIQPSMLGSRSGIFGSSSQPASSQANNACRSAQLESGESSHEKIVNISKNKPKNDFPYDLKRLGVRVIGGPRPAPPAAPGSAGPRRDSDKSWHDSCDTTS